MADNNDELFSSIYKGNNGTVNAFSKPDLPQESPEDFKNSIGYKDASYISSLANGPMNNTAKVYNWARDTDDLDAGQSIIRGVAGGAAMVPTALYDATGSAFNQAGNAAKWVGGAFVKPNNPSVNKSTNPVSVAQPAQLTDNRSPEKASFAASPSIQDNNVNLASKPVNNGYVKAGNGQIVKNVDANGRVTYSNVEGDMGKPFDPSNSNGGYINSNNVNAFNPTGYNPNNPYNVGVNNNNQESDFYKKLNDMYENGTFAMQARAMGLMQNLYNNKSNNDAKMRETILQGQINNYNQLSNNNNTVQNQMKLDAFKDPTLSIKQNDVNRYHELNNLIESKQSQLHAKNGPVDKALRDQLTSEIAAHKDELGNLKYGLMGGKDQYEKIGLPGQESLIVNNRQGRYIMSQDKNGAWKSTPLSLTGGGNQQISNQEMYDSAIAKRDKK